MESRPASDSESDETIVEGSVQESEDEVEDRRLERMLFIHKNAFQLYHTSDFTSGKEAPFGGNSSPVIQLIPKTKHFQLHMKNQQPVETLAYNDATQLGQSQSLLRSGVTYLNGVAGNEGTTPRVTYVDIEHNYSQEDSEDTDETMLDTEMNNDLPTQSSQQEISDNENTPEINLITGDLITSCTSTEERRTAFADELSVGNCAFSTPSLFSSHDSLVESFNVSKAETTNAIQTSLSQALPQEEISAQGNLEKNTSSKSTSNEIPIMDLLRPLSNESRSSSLTTINLSPLLDSLDALSDGAATSKSLAGKQDALPVELLAAINKMPLMTPILPVNETLSLVNENLAINSPTQDNLELRACMFTLHDNNEKISEDLTQITDNEPNLESSRETEHLQEKNIEFSNDKNKNEADTSKYESMDKLTERQTCNVSNATLTTPSYQDNVTGATILRRSRRRVATNSTFPYCGSSVCENHKLQFHTRSKEIKRKAVTPDHEEPSHKLLEYTGEKKVPTLQNTHIVVKDKLEHSGRQGKCNKLLHNNNIQDSKINDALLCSKLQSRELFANSQEYVKINTRSHRGKDKERENITEVETKSKQKDTQHRTTSTTKAHQSSRAEKGSNMSCHDKCQDEPLRNTTKPENEPIITRSASNIAAILKCRKTMKRKNIYGETKLHEAAFNGNVNLLRALIQAGANVNLPDYAGWTALHEASNNGFHEAVLVLLSAGADVNSKGLNGITALQDAVTNGHSQVVKLLLQHGADPFEKNDHGICALDEASDNYMKQLIKSYQQIKAAVKAGGNQQYTKNRDLKSTVDSKIEVCKNSTMSSQNPDTVPSLKRKMESTHPVKNNVQPNKKNHGPGTSCNMNENKTKQHDMEPPLGRPVTRYMVKLQNQFATYSGQKITQSNSLEIQTKSTSVSEVETKLTSYNDNVATGSTSEAQRSLRRSARIRNSTGFKVQADENSTTSKQPCIENSSKQSNRENSQQHPLVLKPCGAVNKNKSIADLRCHESITTDTGSEVTSPEVELADTFHTINMLKDVRNKSTITKAGGRLLTKELLSACNADEQPAQLIKYSKVHVSKEILSKVTPCNLNVEVSQKTENERAGGHCIHESITNNTTSLKSRSSHLPDQDDSTITNKFIGYIPSTESIATAELTIMDDTLPEVEIKQHDHTKNKTLEDNPDSNVILSDVSEFRCNSPMIYEHASGQDLLEPVTSEHISSQQKISSTTSNYERVDNLITEYKTCNNVTSTPDHSEDVILELISQEEHSRDLMTTNDLYNNKPPTCDMVSDCKFNAATALLHLEYQTDESNTNLSELSTSNLNDLKHLARATNIATAKELNASEGGENINDTFAKYQFGDPAQETNKSGPEHVIAGTGRSDDKRNNALLNSDGTSNVDTPEVSTHARSKNKGRKRSCKLCTTESSGVSVRGTVIPKSCLATPKLHALNKRNGKGETRLHHAVIKRDVSSVRSLIAAGIDVNMKDNAGWTALHEASCRGFTDIMQELLIAGADVNCGGMDGLSPLQDAVSGSHYEAVKVLLQNGADPMQKSENGKNAFDEIVDDKIKHLLETYYNSEVTNCEESQPVTGPPHDECASYDVEQTAPTLQTNKGIESPELNISEHESITTLLNEIETKQEKITKFEFKDPENAAQFELELTQIQTVLNEILNKHKAEKEDLVKKFRVSPGSFRQGTLQKQVTALVSRQRRFLNLLQKQKTLDQKLQEYKLKQQQLQQNNLVILKNSSTCTTESRIRTDTLCKEMQLSNHCKGFGTIYASPPQNSESTQEHNFLSQVEIDISANQVTNRTCAIKEQGMECGIGSIATTNLDITNRNNNVSTVSSISVSSHRESNSFESHSLETSQLQAETLNSSQADDMDSASFCSSSQNIPLKASQSINNPENNLESNCGNMLPNTEKSIDTSTMEETCNTQSCLFVLPATQPAEKLVPMNSMQSQTIGQLKILKSNNQFNIMPSSSQCGRNQQQISQLNTAESSAKDQNIKKINAVQQDYQNTSELNACNNEDSSLANASNLSGKQHNSKFLPVDSRTGQRRLLNLIGLIKQGLIQPGKDTLELKLQGVCHKAELQASGMIRGKDGTIYRSPVHWIKELLGDKIPVSRKFAWNKVMYKGKELLKYSSMITTSTAPEIQSISDPVILTDETSSLTENLPKQQRMCTVTGTISPIQKKRSSCSFLQLHEILLVRDEEFLPCHIMNQHWKFYAESDEWNF